MQEILGFGMDILWQINIISREKEVARAIAENWLPHWPPHRFPHRLPHWLPHWPGDDNYILIWLCIFTPCLQPYVLPSLRQSLRHMYIRRTFRKEGCWRVKLSSLN